MITEQIKNELMLLNQKYINESEDAYDFWNNHIKFVVNEAVILAKKYNADAEVVEIGALLHDVALVSNFGSKAEHHINGAKLAEEILTKFNYPKDKTEKVLSCIINHRSSKNATNIEELCVADADILSHFYNIHNSFMLGINKFNFSKPQQFINWFVKDYEDLSPQTKTIFKEKFNNIMKLLFADLWQEI